jgi:hypothetical protein
MICSRCSPDSLRCYDGLVRTPGSSLIVSVLICALVAPATADMAPPPAAAESAPTAAPPPSTALAANEKIVTSWRWPRWIQWSVFLGGVGVTAFGGLLKFDASSQMDNYDQAVASQCAVNGCNLANPQTDLEKNLVAQRENAESRRTFAHITLLAGGATLVTGIILMVLNHPVAKVVQVVPAQGGGTATVGWQF